MSKRKEIKLRQKELILRNVGMVFLLRDDLEEYNHCPELLELCNKLCDKYEDDNDETNFQLGNIILVLDQKLRVTPQKRWLIYTEKGVDGLTFTVDADNEEKARIMAVDYYGESAKNMLIKKIPR